MLGYLGGVTYYHCQAHPTQFFFLYHILPNLSQTQTQAHAIYYNRSWRMLYYFRCRQEVPKRGGTIANEARKHQWMQVYDKINNRQHRWVIACVKLRSWNIGVCTAWVGVLFLKYRHMLTTALRSHNCPSRMLWLCQAESNRERQNRARLE